MHVGDGSPGHLGSASGLGSAKQVVPCQAATKAGSRATQLLVLLQIRLVVKQNHSTGGKYPLTLENCPNKTGTVVSDQEQGVLIRGHYQKCQQTASFENN